VSFVTWAALAIGLAVVAPLLAHLLRRRPPREQPFAPTALVPKSPATARRRTAIEDRALFTVRALAVVGLALLGATPLLKCSRLSLARRGGASVALAVVVDDSLSMRAPIDKGGATRYQRALEGARELLAGLQQGDAVAIVLAGKPARVALAATTNLQTARQTLLAVEQTDRGTDLDGAVELAGELLRGLEHVDKRVVLLSDLVSVAESPALEAPSGAVLWAPLEELRGSVVNCAVLTADRTTRQVAVRIACGGGGDADAGDVDAGSVDSAKEPNQRRVELRAGAELVLDNPLRLSRGVHDIQLAIPVGKELPPDKVLRVVLSGGDAIAADDAAPVVALGGELTVGVVADPARSSVATGGPPPVEQAFRSLQLGVRLKPLPTVPGHKEDLDAIGVLVVDDVPGFTPSERRELAAWVERGGVLLVTLGPRAAAAPLGAGFGPMLPAIVRWKRRAPQGIDVPGDRVFGTMADGMAELNPRGRAELELQRDDSLKVLSAWSDGAPLVLERRLGRGVSLALTLPFSSDESDLVLRPAFLALLKRLVDTARSLGGMSRTTVGTPWSFEGFREVQASFVGDDDRVLPLELGGQGDKRSAIPERIGRYELKLDGHAAERVAAPDELEAGGVPREVKGGDSAAELGGVSATVDISSQVALALLALLFAELALRAYGARGSSRPPRSDPSGETS
jgi:hypothetical protein